MIWHEKIVEVHKTVTDAVSHGHRLQSDRYFVWQEDGRDDLIADDRHAEKLVTGTTDLFTRQEFDPWKDAFETALNSASGVVWELISIQYEEKTGFWHYEWAWRVIG